MILPKGTKIKVKDTHVKDDCDTWYDAGDTFTVHSYIASVRGYVTEQDYPTLGNRVWVNADHIEPILESPEQSSLSTRKDCKIQSDGGSSSYYDLTITNKEGQSLDVRTGDIIRALVGNDFDFGNCIKALRRMYLCTQGKGKQGTDLSYDANKVRYFVDEIENVFGSKD